MKKLAVLILAVIVLLLLVVSQVGNSETKQDTVILKVTPGHLKEYSWNYVEVEYTVKPNDTIEVIANKFIKLNTYNDRRSDEFISGIKELNYPKDLYHLNAGDKLRITYWTKSDSSVNME